MTIPRLVTPRLRLIPKLLFYSGLQGGCPVVGIMGAWTRIDDRISGRRSLKPPHANVAFGECEADRTFGVGLSSVKRYARTAREGASLAQKEARFGAGVR